MVEFTGRPGRTALIPAAYRRIEADLRRRIAAGAWRAGQRLPRQDQFCDEYGVSLRPVRTALMLLEQAGLIQPRRGGVTAIVADPPLGIVIDVRCQPRGPSDIRQSPSGVPSCGLVCPACPIPGMSRLPPVIHAGLHRRIRYQPSSPGTVDATWSSGSRPQLWCSAAVAQV